MKTTPCDIDEIFQKTQLLQNFLKRTTFEPKKLLGLSLTSHPRSFHPPPQLLFAPALVVRLAAYSTSLPPDVEKPFPPQKKKQGHPMNHHSPLVRQHPTHLTKKLPQNEFIFPKFQAENWWNHHQTQKIILSHETLLETRNLTMEEKNKQAVFGSDLHLGLVVETMSPTLKKSYAHWNVIKPQGTQPSYKVPEHLGKLSNSMNKITLD